MHGFWRNWMTAWCWATMAFGAVFALAAAPATDGAARLFFEMVSPAPTGAAMFDPPAMRLTIGVLGAVTIGWALTIFGMVRAADVAGAPAWRSLTMAVLAWYAVDSAISVFSGYPLNAVSNTVFLVTFLAPILGSGVLSVRGRAATA